jgi:cell division protein FtsI/penicillin-binding protein 2
MGSSNQIQLKKLKIVRSIFIVLSLLVVVLLFKWQVFDNERFVAIANERFKDIKLPSIRGSILASDGSTLAYSEPRFDIYIWLPEIESAEDRGDQSRREFYDSVSNILGIAPSELEAKFQTSALWIKIATKIPLESKDALMELKSQTSGKYFRGIQYEYVNRRVYPEDRLASQILGYVGLYDENSQGVWGLEQYWDGTLKPVEGIVSSEFDSFGNPIALADADFVESKPGANLYTTIDKTLQGILEQKLQEGYIAYKAASATGIIMDPKTGAVLAMANYPNFDPNKYYETEDFEAFGNKAISTPYEIGSVAKTFTLSAALDLGKVQSNTVLLPNGHNGCEIISPDSLPSDNCRHPEINKSDKPVECICTYDRKPTSRTIDVLDGLTSSDNIAFRHIALTMTYQEFYEYLVAFGAGAPTQIDLPDESYANLKNYTKWNYADQAVYSYGHGYSMTPLEALSGVASLANDGYRMQPYVVSKVVDYDGNETIMKPKILAKTVKPETAQEVAAMMHKVYLGQLIEKRFKYMSKYNIAMKSGTALIPYSDRAGYSGEINATFVGFDASPEKTFAMLIKLERPQVGDLSYYNARILWLDTFEAIKDHLQVPAY